MSGAESRAAHPRGNPHLVGHLRAEKRVLEALGSGRAHHAWLLSGPRGIGKATFAYHMARFLLSNPQGAARGAEGLGMDENHPVFRQVAAAAHPGLFELVPSSERKTRVISVEEARRLLRFTAMTATDGGWRVAIIDAAEDMNASSANALLKVLEEPPEGVMFLLVSHSPGQLLPTIRSRCLHLPLRPLTAAQVREALALLDMGLDEETLERAARLARGAPGRAVALALSEAAAAFERFRDMASGGGPYDRAIVTPIIRQLAAASAREDFTLFCELLGEWMMETAAHHGRHGHGAAARRWSELAGEAASLVARTQAYNLDRGQMLSVIMRRAEALPVAGLPQSS